MRYLRALSRLVMCSSLTTPWVTGCLGAADTVADAGSGGGGPGSGGTGGGGTGGATGGAGPAGASGGAGGAAGGTSGGSGGALGGSGGAGGDAPTPDAFVGPPGDRDDDGVPNADDNCPEAANNRQEDADADNVGDVCDNCPAATNGDQADADSDGTGDACDLNDDDTDGVPGAADNCPAVFNPEQSDRDNDGIGDACDNCVATPNFSQADDDGDGIGNACEVAGDDDGDGVPDAQDNCPRTPSSDVRDLDNDGIGDVCDNCPAVPNFSQIDGDNDGRGDACDEGDPPDAGMAGECAAGAQRCRARDASITERCMGGEWVPTACGPGQVCQAGACAAAQCATIGALESERGCDFRVTETANLIFDPQQQGSLAIPFGIIVSNPGAQATVVHVRDADERDMALTARVSVPPPSSDPLGNSEVVTSAVFDTNGALVQDQVALAHTVAVPAGGYARFVLPHPNPAHDFGNSQVRRASWHVTSDAPVVVSQHNPICCNGYFSADAALVPPIDLAGLNHRFLGLPTWVSDSGTGYPATLTLMATERAANVDVVRGGTAVAPRPDTGPRIVENGDRRSVMLELGDAVNFESPTVVAGNSPRPDLSGLSITASAPVVMMSSHVCTLVPHGTFACDHVEEYQPPTDRWGRSFTLAAAPLRTPRGAEDITYWRIAADRDETVVVVTADVADLHSGSDLAVGSQPCTALATGVDRFVLSAGQYCELATQTSFGLTASEPVLVMGATVGQEAIQNGGGQDASNGDPATFMVIADEQMTREAYVSPLGTWGRAALQIVAPAGTRLRHQGVVVNLGNAGVPGTDKVVLELSAQIGRLNRLEADQPFRATLFLYGQGVAVALPVNQALHLSP